jgi:hypothetical protein
MPSSLEWWRHQGMPSTITYAHPSTQEIEDELEDVEDDDEDDSSYKGCAQDDK